MNEIPASDTIIDIPLTEKIPVKFVVLADEYAPAYIGLAISATRRPRSVYSLVKLTRMTSKKHSVSPGKAREDVWNMVLDLTNEHGDDCPVFVDDTVTRGGKRG